MDSTTGCSNNLNQYSCFAVSKSNEFCAWNGNLCSKIEIVDTIGIKTYTRINANTCALVNEPLVIASYNDSFQRC